MLARRTRQFWVERTRPVLTLFYVRLKSDGQVTSTGHRIPNTRITKQLFHGRLIHGKPSVDCQKKTLKDTLKISQTYGKTYLKNVSSGAFLSPQVQSRMLATRRREPCMAKARTTQISAAKNPLYLPAGAHLVVEVLQLGSVAPVICEPTHAWKRTCPRFAEHPRTRRANNDRNGWTTHHTCTKGQHVKTARRCNSGGHFALDKILQTSNRISWNNLDFHKIVFHLLRFMKPSFLWGLVWNQVFAE